MSFAWRGSRETGISGNSNEEVVWGVEKKLSVGALFFLLLASLVLGSVTLSRTTQYFLVGSMLAMGLLFLLVRKMEGFLLFVVYVLGLAFYTLWLSFHQGLDLGQQWTYIWRQIICTLAVGVVWLFVYSIKQQQEELLRLDTRLQELQKVEAATGVMLFSEFLDRAQWQFTGVKRRGEGAFYVLVQIVGDGEEKPYKLTVQYAKVVNILLESVRQHYDLVGKLAHDKLVVFLSNTDRQGVAKVLERIHQRVDQERNLTMAMLRIHTGEITGNWEDFAQELAALAEDRRVGEGS